MATKEGYFPVLLSKHHLHIFSKSRKGSRKKLLSFWSYAPETSGGGGECERHHLVLIRSTEARVCNLKKRKFCLDLEVCKKFRRRVENVSSDSECIKKVSSSTNGLPPQKE